MSTYEERGITHSRLCMVFKHQDVELSNHKFCISISETSLPLIIICGNSNKMIEISTQALNSSNISYSSPRFGIIRS